jgi:hypothetical protein
MSHRLNFEIAGIGICMKGVDGIRFVETDPLRQMFVTPANRKGPVDISIEVRLDSNPTEKRRSFEPVFHSGGPWSLWQDGERFLIRLQPPGDDAPHCQAFFSRDFSSGTVYCGDAATAGRAEGPRVANPMCYPLDQVVTMHHLASRAGVLVHAAGAVYRGRGLIFPGVSGAGKSTIAKLLSARGHTLLSDDRIVMRITEDGPRGWGTPWPGEGRMALNQAIALDGIVFLNQAPVNDMTPLTPGQALKRLLPMVSVPWYRADFFEPVLQTCGALVGRIPAFDLFFAPSAGVADVLDTLLVDS